MVELVILMLCCISWYIENIFICSKYIPTLSVKKKFVPPK